MTLHQVTARVCNDILIPFFQTTQDQKTPNFHGFSRTEPMHLHTGLWVFSAAWTDLATEKRSDGLVSLTDCQRRCKSFSDGRDELPPWHKLEDSWHGFTIKESFFFFRLQASHFSRHNSDTNTIHFPRLFLQLSTIKTLSGILPGVEIFNFKFKDLSSYSKLSEISRDFSLGTCNSFPYPNRHTAYSIQKWDTF